LLDFWGTQAILTHLAYHLQRSYTVGDMINIFFKKLNPNAVLPTKAYAGDAAFDLYSDQEQTIEPGETKLISTGLQLANFRQTEGVSSFLKIEGRSGLACKGIFPVGGIVDTQSYRGEIKCIMHNSSKGVYTFEKGERVAQAIFYQIMNLPSQITIEETDTVIETQRGTGGFGSSGR
jgi:dUTP pyrophosphatase